MIHLIREFTPKISIAAWQRLLLCEWAPDQQVIGFGLFDGDTLVGFLGTIFSRRVINGEISNFCNLHTCYVRQKYRAKSPALLFAAMAQSGYTLTALTPNQHVCRILEAARFKTLEAYQRLYPPLVNSATALRSKARVITGIDRIAPLLDEADAKIMSDHQRYDCGHFVVLTENEYAFIVTRRKLARNLSLLPVSDVLFIRNPQLAVAHFERLKFAVLWAERTVALRIDERLLGPQPPIGVRRRRKCFFRSDTVTALDIDNLYSELVFLPA